MSIELFENNASLMYRDFVNDHVQVYRYKIWQDFFWCIVYSKLNCVIDVIKPLYKTGEFATKLLLFRSSIALFKRSNQIIFHIQRKSVCKSLSVYKVIFSRLKIQKSTMYLPYLWKERLD